MGSWGVLAVYILTGAAGNLLSTLYNWVSPLHDSSADPAIFRPALVHPAQSLASPERLIVLLKSHRLPVPPLELHKLRRSVIYFAAINLAIGITISGGNMWQHSGLNIDNLAHLGGLLCGLLFALPLVPRIGSPREEFLFRLRMAIAMVVGILVLFGFFHLPCSAT